MNLFALILAITPASPPPTLADLQWMVGSWRQERGAMSTTETWSPPVGDTMMGTSQTVRAGKTVAHEFLRLHQSAQGTITYIALPSGQKETSFKLTDLKGQQAVFENPTHDYPQRITYTREANGTLVAAIENLAEPKRRMEFKFKKG